ncbi:MAG: hypothetical protein KatS3mg043_1371 [Rhodothermaceae bacterium]|nr:MAG: hypothetical protein KatS3mg043_1371 [Rhodothermaceae bacterium]
MTTRELIARRFGLPPERLPEGATMVNVPGWSGPLLVMLEPPGFALPPFEPPVLYVQRTAAGPAIAYRAPDVWDAAPWLERERQHRAALLRDLAGTEDTRALTVLKGVQETARAERDAYLDAARATEDEARRIFAGWYVCVAIRAGLTPAVPPPDYFVERAELAHRLRRTSGAVTGGDAVSRRRRTLRRLLDALRRVHPPEVVLAGEVMIAWRAMLKVRPPVEHFEEALRALQAAFPPAHPPGETPDPLPYLRHLAERVGREREAALHAETRAVAAEAVAACVVLHGTLPEAPVPGDGQVWRERPRGRAKVTHRQKQIVRRWVEEEIERALSAGMSAPREAAYAAVAERLAERDIEVSPRTVRRWIA